MFTDYELSTKQIKDCLQIYFDGDDHDLDVDDQRALMAHENIRLIRTDIRHQRNNLNLKIRLRFKTVGDFEVNQSGKNDAAISNTISSLVSWYCSY